MSKGHLIEEVSFIIDYVNEKLRRVQGLPEINKNALIEECRESLSRAQRLVQGMREE